MKKRIVSFFISLIVISTIFSGCNNTSKDKEKVSQLKGKLNVYIYGKDKDYFSQAIKEFTKKNPKVTINIITSKIEDNLKEILLKADNDNVPDIIEIKDNYLKKNIEDNPSFFYKFKDSENYINSQNAYEDKNLYAVPIYCEPVGILYRKDTLNKENIDPSEIKTWKDYLEIGKLLKEKLNKKMISLDYDNTYTIYLPMLNQLNVQLTDDKGKYNIDSDESKRILKNINSMFKEDIVSDYSNENENIRKFIEGETLSIICTPKMLNEINSKMVKIKDSLQFCKLPSFEIGGNRDAIMPGMNLAVNKLGENKSIAIKFVDFLVSNSQLKIDFKKYGNIPSNKQIYTSTEYSVDDKFLRTEIYDVYIDIIKQSYKYNYGYEFNKIEKELENIIKQDLSNEEILNKEVDRVKQEFTNKYMQENS